jgi:N utilization substance protein B
MLQGSRREARERALELLYEAEAKGQKPAEVLLDLPITPDGFAVALVTGVGERQAELDGHIARLAKDWTIERMPWVDRSILRLAAFELVARPDVPTGVILSEAVELAKRFSTEEAGRFVNGLLSNLARQVRPNAPAEPPGEGDIGPPEDEAGESDQGAGEDLGDDAAQRG